MVAAMLRSASGFPAFKCLIRDHFARPSSVAIFDAAPAADRVRDLDERRELFAKASGLSVDEIERAEHVSGGGMFDLAPCVRRLDTALRLRRGIKRYDSALEALRNGDMSSAVSILEMVDP